MTKPLLTLLLLLPAAGLEAAEVFRWKLDELSGTTAVESISGANGTYTRDASNTTASGPGGLIPRGQSFTPASSDAVDISAAGVSFASNAAFSVGAWMENDATGSTAVVGMPSSTLPAIRKQTDTAFQVASDIDQKQFIVPSQGTTDWHHVLITRTTGNSCRVFVDGVESSTGALALVGVFAPTRIGVRSGVFADATFADVRIWDTDESANAAALYAEKDASGQSHAPRVLHLFRLGR